LFQGAKRQKTNPEKPISWAYFGTDDDVYEEFDWLKDHITDAWYNRYELSNFAKPGMSSIHNRVYRDFEAYLGIGIWAASLLLEPKVHRRTNTKDLNEYLKWNRIDKETAVNLTKKDILIEKFFLGLRTDIWLADITEFEDVLVKDYQKKLKEYQKLWLLEQYKNFVILTDEGMDVFNTIVTNLLEEI
jgi:oxygen-independent coproporphyrinogen-3 oxidase